MMATLAFIFTIGLLVTIHEYGHFQVAKWCGVKVLKFSIGFGKPLWQTKFGKDQTEFILAAIPLGGYVKMLDERDFVTNVSSQSLLESESQNIYSTADLKRAFNRQSLAKRIAIVLAGPLANLLLAIILYWGLLMTGVTGLKPIIGQVVDNSPAAIASMKTGEMIQKINGKQVATWQEVSLLLLEASFSKKYVEIETVTTNHETHLHQLLFPANGHGEINENILQQLGLSVYQPDIQAIIGQVESGSPANNAGLKLNDLILVVRRTYNIGESDVFQVNLGK